MQEIQITWEHLRSWQDRDGHGFRLELYDTYRTDDYGKSILAYQLFHKKELIFQGDDFHCPPSIAIDSNASLGSLLVFLSLRPGDVDREYFASYTPRQLEWAQEWGETLYLYAVVLQGGLR